MSVRAVAALAQARKRSYPNSHVSGVKIAQKREELKRDLTGLARASQSQPCTWANLAISCGMYSENLFGERAKRGASERKKKREKKDVHQTRQKKEIQLLRYC